jgi:hypothetical protein
MSAVWECSLQKNAGLLIMLAIADHADDDGIAYPGVPRLARKARVTERHARRLIHQLARAGEIEIASGAGKNGTNVYRIKLPLINRHPDKLSADAEVRSPLTPASAPPDTRVRQTIREPSRKHQASYPPEFEKAYSVLPRSEGSSKKAAHKAWSARVRGGVPPAELIAGAERYAAYNRATGQYPKHAQTFFGPGEFWKLAWTLPDGRNGYPSATDKPAATSEEYARYLEDGA